MAYTAINKPSDYFNTVLYTGNNSSQAITGVGFQPDWIWLKSRTGTYGAYNPQAYDSVRGFTTGGDLTPANSNVEGVDSGAHGYISAVGADGFTLTGGSTNSHQNNGASTTYASWNWKAGTSFTNDASSTGVGSIDSAGSVNQDAGFSIIGYSGDTSDAPSTVAHGLSQKPEMMFIKRRTLSGQWVVYNKTIGATNNLHLDSTDASSAYQYFFNNTEPTSSVFTVGDDGESNKTGSNYIAYCFHSVQGYSKIGSYTGNGSADGSFVHTGFKPAYVMVKKTDSATQDEGWYIFDNKRSDFNLSDDALRANLGNAEIANWGVGFDFLSNGLKVRASDPSINVSGSVYIYMAFAEHPFVSSTGTPTTAR
jgi:hypothetical protein